MSPLRTSCQLISGQPDGHFAAWVGPYQDALWRADHKQKQPLK